jgi:hypothetical protein
MSWCASSKRSLPLPPLTTDRLTLCPPVRSGQYVAKTKNKCMDTSWKKSLTELRNTTFDTKGSTASRQWTYQTCNEFGYFQVIFFFFLRALTDKGTPHPRPLACSPLIQA